MRTALFWGYYAACSGNFLPTFRNKEATTTRCVITQKGAVLVCFAAEACNHAYVHVCGVATLRHVRSSERLRIKKATVLDFCPFNMGPIGCLETSVRNYHYLLGNSPEGLSFHIIGFAYYYYYHRISHFSALAGKYSPILGCSNQQD